MKSWFLDGPQMRKLINDHSFPTSMNENESPAWIVLRKLFLNNVCWEIEKCRTTKKL